MTSPMLQIVIIFHICKHFLSSLDTLLLIFLSFCVGSEQGVFLLPISESYFFLSFGTFLSLPEFSFCVTYDECYMAFRCSHITVMDAFFFFLSCLFCRSLTSNLPNVNLPNVNLQIPKVPNLPVPVAGLSVNLPQMPSFSTPSWMAAIYDSECVFN